MHKRFGVVAIVVHRPGNDSVAPLAHRFFEVHNRELVDWVVGWTLSVFMPKRIKVDVLKVVSVCGVREFLYHT